MSKDIQFELNKILYGGLTYNEYVQANKDNEKCPYILIESLSTASEVLGSDGKFYKKWSSVTQTDDTTEAEYAVLYYKGVRYAGRYKREVFRSGVRDIVVTTINGVQLA